MIDEYGLHIISHESNYTYILFSGTQACIIDPANFEATDHFLTKNNLKPKIIINTHHHYDHSGGNIRLKNKYGCFIAGGSTMIPGIDRVLRNHEILNFDNHSLLIDHTPGHTLDSICIRYNKMIFTGDTLFTGGCGRVFEGSFEMMYKSLKKLSCLPSDTMVYCGHNYILENLKFALTIHPEDKDMVKFKKIVLNKFNQGIMHVPSTIGDENKINPFFRADSPESFTQLRKQKDRF